MLRRSLASFNRVQTDSSRIGSNLSVLADTSTLGTRMYTLENFLIKTKCRTFLVPLTLKLYLYNTRNLLYFVVINVFFIYTEELGHFAVIG